MAIYNRYQPLHAAEQHLFCEGCPVYVHRYQLSADLQTGDRMLQVRMVNMAEQEISAVFLRIACLDGAGRALSTMYAVPVTNQNATRGSIFGENCVLRLSTSATQSVQIFPERVVYANGTAWNETESSAYITLPAPIPVRMTDPDFDRLEAQGQRSGVHNDYRYQELENAWYCTCGLPNVQRRQFCGYCGTNREWLRLNMNGRAAVTKYEPPVAPEPVIPEPAPLPEPEPETVAQPVVCVSVPVAVEERLPEKAAEEEFPVIDPQPPKKSRAGKVIGIVLVVLALLAIAAFCALRFLLPVLQYNRANDLEAAGNYEEARAIFTELGDYEDAPERVSGTWYKEALERMKAGDYQGYQDAYNIFMTIPGYENADGYAADCIYSMGVLSYNAGDLHEAWDLVCDLKTNYPDYEGTRDLEQSCCYSFGNDCMDNGDYAGGKTWFLSAGDYKNSEELAQYCDYEIACALRDEGSYDEAAETFRACTYGDSEQQMFDCMLQYVKTSGSREDLLTERYLTELAEAGYEEAETLMKELYGWKFEITVNNSRNDAKAPETLTVTDLKSLFFHIYAVGGHADETVSVLAIYTLPGNKTGNEVCVKDAVSGTRVSLTWSDLKLPTPEKGKITIKFCNADTGEELRTVTIEYK